MSEKLRNKKKRVYQMELKAIRKKGDEWKKNTSEAGKAEDP